MIEIIEARTPEHVQTVRSLLLEYRESLGIDLSFQSFDEELLRLPGNYAPPTGRLMLAMSTEVHGCAALQRVDDRRAEMKRLYVRTAARGIGVGKALLARVLSEAKSIGYSSIVLDTLPTMREAQRLYEQFGFRDIDAYRANPIIGTRYLGLRLG
jgi:putative acetyltransferase